MRARKGFFMGVPVVGWMVDDNPFCAVFIYGEFTIPNATATKKTPSSDIATLQETTNGCTWFDHSLYKVILRDTPLECGRHDAHAKNARSSGVFYTAALVQGGYTYT